MCNVTFDQLVVGTKVVCAEGDVGVVTEVATASEYGKYARVDWAGGGSTFFMETEDPAKDWTIELVGDEK